MLRPAGFFQRVPGRTLPSVITPRNPDHDIPHVAAFVAGPQPTVFIVNVIHAHPGKQEQAFSAIQDVVHYVARTKQGFLWSNLSKSTDGKTVVNIEAISGANKVDEFFSDPVFLEKFRRLDEVSTSEFHTYRVDDLCCRRRHEAVASIWRQIPGGGRAARPAQPAASRLAGPHAEPGLERIAEMRRAAETQRRCP